LLELIHLFHKFIWQGDFVSLKLMSPNFSPINAEPFPQFRNIPAPGRPEVAEVGDYDPQVFRVSLAREPEVNSFSGFRCVELHSIELVKI
jgi:hypothetical protein